MNSVVRTRGGGEVPGGHRGHGTKVSSQLSAKTDSLQSAKTKEPVAISATFAFCKGFELMAKS
jgi:hypothetical protein